MPFISNGTTILDNGAFSVGLGNQILLSTQTASGASSIEFTSGIDSTYDIYKFIFHDVRTGDEFQMNLSTDSGSNYNVTKTTTAFRAYHTDNDASTSLEYMTTGDLAQSTSNQSLNFAGTNSVRRHGGEMYLFSPSSSTYVKHFTSRVTGNNSAAEYDNFIAGYGNTTSPINAVRFNTNSGTISGTIKMYGIKGS